MLVVPFFWSTWVVLFYIQSSSFSIAFALNMNILHIYTFTIINLQQNQTICSNVSVIIFRILGPKNEHIVWQNNKKIHQPSIPYALFVCVCVWLFVDLLVSCCHPIYHEINDTSDTIKFNSWQNNEITLHRQIVGVWFKFHPKYSVFHFEWLHAALLEHIQNHHPNGNYHFVFNKMHNTIYTWI